MDPIEPTSMASGTIRGYAAWWTIVWPTPLGMHEENEDEKMVIAPLEGSSDEDEKILIISYMTF